jgi:hypothetical protein
MVAFSVGEGRDEVSIHHFRNVLIPSTPTKSVGCASVASPTGGSRKGASISVYLQSIKSKKY